MRRKKQRIEGKKYANSPEEEEVSKYSKGVQMQVLSMNDGPNSEYIVINMYQKLERLVLD